MEFGRNLVGYIGHLAQGRRGPADHDGELSEPVCIAVREHFDLFLLLSGHYLAISSKVSFKKEYDVVE